MCTVAMNSRVNECFKETRAIFSRMFTLDIREPKKVGGIGSFAVKNVFKENGIVYVGEAAGIQDALWGFGIRSALVSGYFAAQSIIHNTDYESIAKNHFTKRLKASVVNRFLWEVLNGEAYTFLLKLFKKMKNPEHFLYNAYNYTFMQKMLYPVSRIYFTRIVDKNRRFL
jgi:flavin-dependent dehydrogenase